MARTIRVLFRRDPSRDRHDNDIPFEGYEILWPEGKPVAVGFNAFCKHGQRLMGLGKHLLGCHEKFVDLMCFHLGGREDTLPRLPGARVRRFCIRRTGRQGRLHFLDGTATAIVFDLDSDEARVLWWIGLTELPEGRELWIDVAARPVEAAPPLPVGLEASPSPALS